MQTSAALPGKLLTAKEVAELLAVPLHSVYRLSRQGEPLAPAVLRLGGRVPYRREALVQVLESCTTEAAYPP
jgi:predicted DNA-binding transcriptional regulator AlpA